MKLLLLFAWFASLSVLGHTSLVHKRSAEDDGRDITTNCGPGDPAPPNRVDTTIQLASLRSQMITRGINAYIVPNDEDGRRSYISGFSGSNGDAIVTLDQAACWTDGRYFLQASQELDCNWELMRMGQPGVPTYVEWLKGDSNIGPGSVVGADPSLTSAQTWLDMKKDLAAAGIEMRDIAENLVDIVWTDKPAYTPRTLVVHPMTFAGKSYEDKIGDLRSDLASLNFDAMVVSEKDEFAWLFNIRAEGDTNSGGLMNSPFFDCLAVVSKDELLVWVRSDEQNSDIMDHLNGPDCDTNKTCATVGDVENAVSQLENWAGNLASGSRVMITGPTRMASGASYDIYQAVPEEMSEFGFSPVIYPRAKKNPTEVQGMINAHERDAYALVEFLAFMEDQISNKGMTNWTEIDASDLLKSMRLKQTDNRGLSFDTIAGAGANGAVIHYRPTEETNAMVNDSSVFLVDSGGQYLDGTTDVTRTLHYGTASAEVIDRYTRVLMGAIDLAKAVVPVNTQDTSIDLATRQHLFDVGLDYRHGTGHGIGAYGGVHENPISVRMSGSTPALLDENMFFSDEPGYYEDGAYGIRLETVIRAVKKEVGDGTYGGFIGFEPVTIVPFEPKLIDFSLMTESEIEWYNNYNTKIMDTLGPYFESIGRSDIVAWLETKTAFVDPNPQVPQNPTTPTTPSAMASTSGSRRETYSAFLAIGAFMILKAF